MAIWAIYVDEAGDEVRIPTHWPRHPDVRGPSELQHVVLRALDGLGPYSHPVTIPEVDADLQRSLEARGLRLRGHAVEHDLARQLLIAAVRQAQESTLKEIEYHKVWFERDARDDSETSSAEDRRNQDVMDYVLMSFHLDSAVEASRNAVVLATASLEAFINQVADRELAEVWSAEEDRLSLQTKWLVVAKLLSGGKTFDKGAEPFQSFSALVALRNRLMHPRAEERIYEGDGALSEASRWRPEWDATVSSGRHACVTARRLHIEFARISGREAPRWCAHVPSGDPDDLARWRSAVIATGVRDNPDFPPWDRGDFSFTWAGEDRRAEAKRLADQAEATRIRLRRSQGGKSPNVNK